MFSAIYLHPRQYTLTHAYIFRCFVFSISAHTITSLSAHTGLFTVFGTIRYSYQVLIKWYPLTLSTVGQNVHKHFSAHCCGSHRRRTNQIPRLRSGKGHLCPCQSLPWSHGPGGLGRSVRFQPWPLVGREQQVEEQPGIHALFCR